MEREMDVWKAALLMFLICIGIVAFTMWCADQVEVEAAVITGDEAVGGVGYYLDKYVKNGGNPQDLISVYPVSADDIEVLYRITEAEVTGEGNSNYYEAKKNVASCVITRWLNGWGDTVHNVVFAPKQFSPISDGRYYTVEITEQTKRAVHDVLRNGKTHSYEYFCANCESYRNGWFSTLKEFYYDGIHHYFTGEKR